MTTTRTFFSYRFATLALAAASGAPTLAAPVYIPHVSDFYQHQQSLQAIWPTVPATPYPGPPAAAPAAAGYANGNWWEPDGGWCRTTAWVNAIYSWDARGKEGLFDRSERPGAPAADMNKTWLERFAYCNEELAIASGGLPGVGGGCATPPHILAYAAAAGYGATTIDTYKWDAVNKEVDRETPAGDVKAGKKFENIIRKFITRPNQPSIVIQINDAANPNPAWWWSGSFHALTIAGVDDVTERLYWSDPNNTPYGQNWGVPFPATDPVPVGAAHYDSGFLGLDGRTFITGNYTGAQIEKMWVMRVPTPGAAALLGFAALALARRKRD